MGCFSTVTIVPEKSVKVFRRVAINRIVDRCVFEIDDEKWEFVGTNLRPPEPNVVEFIESTLKNRLEEAPCVRIEELSISNWFFNPEIFASVDVRKLQIVIIGASYVPGFLSTFLDRKLTHLTVVNMQRPSHVLDELQCFDVDYLLVLADTQDDRSKLTGFRAKQWEISEGVPEEVEERVPYILPFVEKMVLEKSQIGCNYYAHYYEALDISELLKAVKEKYPEAEECADGKHLLTLKLDDREINVRQFGSYPQVTYKVTMDRRGTAISKKDMTIIDRVRTRLADKYPKMMRFQLLLATNLLLIPLMLLTFFLFWNPFISIPFLVFWILQNLILVRLHFHQNRKREDPFLFYVPAVEPLVFDHI